jgi:hypothetical protein
MEFSPGDGDDNFPAHDLPFEVGVGIIFIPVVTILLYGLVGSSFRRR